MKNSLLISILFLCRLSWADTFYVLPVEGEGLPANEKSTVRELIRQAVMDESDHKPSSNRDTADLVFRGRAMSLGSSLLMRLEKLVQGQVRYSAKLKSASVEDLDVVTTRLVRSVLTEQAPEDTMTVTDVTENELTKGRRRIPAQKQWQFGLGPAWGSNLNDSGGGLNFGFGFAWGVEPQVDLQLFTDFYSSADQSDARFSSLGIGLNYYLTQSTTAPFLGIDFGYAGAQASDGCEDDSFLCGISSDDDASGWNLGGQIGVKLFRQSSVNLGLVLRYSHLFDKTAVSQKQPALTSFKVVVYW